MGVKTLWNVLECTGEPIAATDLRGAVLAIDLAGWAVASQQINSLNSSGNVSSNKAHLRNLFCRFVRLHRMQITPIFVLDGKAPAWKSELLAMRSGRQSKSTSRARLRTLLGECKSLLAALGVECITADGEEGEKLASRLSKSGLVDGVITDDSDALCYGARVVIRKFNISVKTTTTTRSIERYTSANVASSLGLTRDKLVFLAVMLGCDMLPAGVTGVGKEAVMSLFSLWPDHWNALTVLHFWIRSDFRPWTDCRSCCGDSDDISSSHCAYCKTWVRCCAVASSSSPASSSAAANTTLSAFSPASSSGMDECICAAMRSRCRLVAAESIIKRKIAKMDDNLNQTVLDTILAEFGNCVADEDDAKGRELTAIVARIKTDSFPFKRPQLSSLLTTLTHKLAWTTDYAISQLLPLVTRHHLASASSSLFRDRSITMDALLKRRIVDGLAAVDVRWRSEVAESDLPAVFETRELAGHVSAAYPDEYAAFVDDKRRKKAKGVAKVRVKTEKVKRTERLTRISGFFGRQNDKADAEADRNDEGKDDSCLAYTSDMSAIIDDILAQGEADEADRLLGERAESARPKLTPNQKLTTKRLSFRTRLALKMRLTTDEDENNNKATDETLEDSFDRMCL